MVKNYLKLQFSIFFKRQILFIKHIRRLQLKKFYLQRYKTYVVRKDFKMIKFLPQHFFKNKKKKKKQLRLKSYKRRQRKLKQISELKAKELEKQLVQVKGGILAKYYWYQSLNKLFFYNRFATLQQSYLLLIPQNVVRCRFWISKIYHFLAKFNKVLKRFVFWFQNFQSTKKYLTFFSGLKILISLINQNQLVRGFCWDLKRQRFFFHTLATFYVRWSNWQYQRRIKARAYRKRQFTKLKPYASQLFPNQKFVSTEEWLGFGEKFWLYMGLVLVRRIRVLRTRWNINLNYNARNFFLTVVNSKGHLILSSSTGRVGLAKSRKQKISMQAVKQVMESFVHAFLQAKLNKNVNVFFKSFYLNKRIKAALKVIATGGLKINHIIDASPKAHSLGLRLAKARRI